MQTPLDAFVLAQLEQNGLQPAAPADRLTLLRRATFDLTGLPPTPEETTAFLEDTAPDAWSRTVDRLLASPRYGERWARHWLDVARYADTKGYVYTDREEGRFVHSSAYRDWVIRALNDDLPYDRFLALQIAADQLVDGPARALPNQLTPGLPNRADLAAMGFLTLGRRFLGVVHDIIDDRIDVVTRGTLGLTVSCARCHDHKYDPIPTTDYYSLYGIFAGATERLVPLEQPESDPAWESFAKGLREREQKYARTMQEKRELFSQRFRLKSVEYLLAALDPSRFPTEEFYEIRGPDDLNPTIVRQWSRYLNQPERKNDPVFQAWHALAELPPAEFATRAISILDRLENGGANSVVLTTLRAQPLQSMADVATAYGRLFVQRATPTASEAAAPPRISEAEQAVRGVLYAPDSPARIPDVATVDLEWFFDEKTRIELAKLQMDLEQWIIKAEAAPPYAVILEDRPELKPAHVFVRGNPAVLGPEVPRRFLQALSPRAFRHGSGRLELALAIASKENPLTARVLVNRLWAVHFGAGLVKTTSDFGVRSEPPSHPELLDWLSVYFIEHNWSLKKLHRLILLSSAYQQSSDPPDNPTRARAKLIDPENRLLWHNPRQRLDLEALRDALLSVTGELDQSMGGKAQPLFGPGARPRRSVYGFIDRQFLPGVMRVFDFANPDMHAPQRLETTVPQQALFFMNSSFLAERARVLAAHPRVRAAGSSRAKIDTLFRLVYQRPPTTVEQEDLALFVATTPARPSSIPTRPLTHWQYGYGEFDPGSQRLNTFSSLPHFTGEAWQGGPHWPDAKLGWVRLTASGGHTGNDLAHAAVRRWTAPADLTVRIRGSLQHVHDQGDGVRARVLASSSGQLGTWTMHQAEVRTDLPEVALRKGDTLDFVVDLNQGLNNDDFVWSPLIEAVPPEGTSAAAQRWNAKDDFSGPPELEPAPLTSWEQLAQVLLLSSEFYFVN